MNITHIFHLLRAYWIENKKMILICFLIIFTAAVLDLSFNYSSELSSFVAIIIPCWIAGRYFQSSLKNNNSTHFFNLPVTSAEKLINASIIVLLIGIISWLLSNTGAYIGYYGLRPLIKPEVGSLYERFPDIAPAFGKWHLQSVLFSIITLFVFLFGSIYFKKNAFWKSLACGAGFFIGLAIYQIGLLSITFGKNFNKTIPENHTTNINILGYNDLADYNIIFPVVIVLFISLTYLRLRETEV